MTREGKHDGPSRVVVLGSGFAGLETAFLLRSRLGADRVHLTVLSDRDDFLFKPSTIYLPCSGAEAPLHIPLDKPLAQKDINFRITTVEGIDAGRGIVHTGRATACRPTIVGFERWLAT